MLNAVLFPILLSVLYADLWTMSGAVLVIILVLVALLPIRAPHLVFARAILKERLSNPKRFKFSLDFSSEMALLVVSALAIFSFYLGQSRFERLKRATPAVISAGRYEGKATVLIRVNSETILLMEKSLKKPSQPAGQQAAEEQLEEQLEAQANGQSEDEASKSPDKRLHRRFIFVDKDSLVSETDPPRSSKFIALPVKGASK